MDILLLLIDHDEKYNPKTLIPLKNLLGNLLDQEQHHYSTLQSILTEIHSVIFVIDGLIDLLLKEAITINLSEFNMVVDKFYSSISDDETLFFPDPQNIRGGNTHIKVSSILDAIDEIMLIIE